MKLFSLGFLLLTAHLVFAQTAIKFEDFFENKTLRVDYFHTGTATQEHISLDQAYEQGVWAGSRKNLIDILNLGKYLVKVFDVATNQLVFSRGYASVYGEWETTREAQDELFRSFHESVLLPFPKKDFIGLPAIAECSRSAWCRLIRFARPQSNASLTFILNKSNYHRMSFLCKA